MGEIVGTDLGKFGHASVKVEGGKIFAGVEIGAEVLIRELFAKAKAAVELPGGVDDLLLTAVEAYVIDLLKKQG